MNAGRPDGLRLTYVLDGRPVAVDFSQPRVLIGRGADCDLLLPLQGVSRRHAVIEREGEGWVVRDLGSRNGTYVNYRRVTNQRLVDGDRISPGPTDWVPVTITFHLAPTPSSHRNRVLFADRVEGAKISLSINVEDYEGSLDGGPGIAGSAGVSGSVAAEVPGAGAGGSAAAAAAEGRLAPAGVSMIALFRQVGEALLTVEDLDEMLGKVVDLALDNVPAERGFVCLCDETTETITPKATRTRGLAQGESIAISSSIAGEVIRARQAILVTDVASDERFAQAESIKQMRVSAAMCAPLYHAGHVQGLIYVDTRRSEKPFVARHLELLTALGVLSAVGLRQARLREDVSRERAIRARLSRYSSPAVVDQIVADASTLDGRMSSEERMVSVLFADLCGFTSLAEGMEPAEVARVLNGAFEQLTRAVFVHGGTLDKYMGDAVMAIFGAPLPQADHAERAIRAALLMQQLLDEFNRGQPQGQALRMRIGINSGTAVVGDIGSPTRKDYTVIGDAVNVASRLESSVAQPGQVVIGPATYELAREEFGCEALPEVRLRGKQEFMRPYLVVRSTTTSTLPPGDATVVSGDA